MENKKISFGFLKTKKQEKPVESEEREYIESVEENAIKIVGKELTQVVEPIIIPMKPNTLITAERLREIAEKVENSLNEPDVVNQSESQNEIKHSENETLDEMAVKELLQDAKKEKKCEVQSLKILVPSIPVIDGQKESSLDDYESVPIREFGMAMLRGMGWTPGKEVSKYKPPNLRPKGLGLGADKVIKENQKNVPKENDKELVIVKNACVRITTGKYSGCYGKVVSLDDDNGRVMVNIPVKKDTVSLSEFMMQPVTKSEFDQQAKVINADSYEAFKKNELAQKSYNKSIDNESSSSHKSNYVDSKDRRKREGNQSSQKKNEHSNGRSKEKCQREKRDSTSSEDNTSRRRREKKRYSSNDSLSSDSERRKKRDNKQCSSSNSENDHKMRHKSSSHKGKRDIDKKRKGKKKKRDRDRSPSHRKHRK